VAHLVEVEYLPARLHNTPDRIVPALAPRVDRAVEEGRRVFVAYADCGTGGRLDSFLAERPGVARLPGAHCYEVFAGHDVFSRLHAEAPGTFYLTDFLARNFDALVWRGLGLHRAPQLREVYFGNYTRLVHLAQTGDPALSALAEQAAHRLGLAFERLLVGRGGLTVALDVVPAGDVVSEGAA
jgi:hypothetical protein